MLHYVALTPDIELHLVRVHTIFALRSWVRSERMLTHHPFQEALRFCHIILQSIDSVADHRVVLKAGE